MTQHNQERAPFHEDDPTQYIQFAEFDITQHTIDQIAGINGPIVDELAVAFGVEKPRTGWDVTSLKELITIIGPAKTLQDNIPAIEALLPEADDKQIAIEWIEQSGLLDAVFRNFDSPEQMLPRNFDTAVITGGVRNWMMRRAQVLIDTIQNGTTVSEIKLVAGTRQMRTAEGDDVIEGDTEASYMQRVIKPLLEAEVECRVAVVSTDTDKGNEIAEVVANETQDAASVLVACNAGNWIQNGGQIRRAIGDDRVFVVSNPFPIAKNNEPPALGQNYLTALGIIARNLQELARHT